MDVKLYGKPGCKLCAGAEEKFVLMQIPYEKFDIERFSAPHDGWRDDGSVEIQALHCLINMMVPMILIDGKPYAYTAAMRALKTLKRNV